MEKSSQSSNQPERISGRVRSICLPIPEGIDYKQLVEDGKAFRQYIDEFYTLCPDLFPKELREGYCLNGFSRSKKQLLPIRQIRLLKTSATYQIQPIMFQQLTSLTTKLFPCLSRSHDLKDLTLKAENLVRKLNELPIEESLAVPRDSIEQMKSICLLLERAIDRNESKPVQDEFLKTSPVKQEVSSIPVGVSVVEPKSEISATAKELIRVRDWVLVAKSGDREISPTILETLYRQLGQLIEIEGVTSIEEDGMCNYHRHRVLGTEPTDDPNKEDLIHSTVRPGYLFNNKLIRPQEVIVHTLT